MNIFLLWIAIFSSVAWTKPNYDPVYYVGHFGCFKVKKAASDQAGEEIAKNCKEYKVINSRLSSCSEGKVKYIVTYQCESRKQ